MKTRLQTLPLLGAALVLLGSGVAAAQTVTVKGTLRGANGYTIALLSKDGSSKTKTLTTSGSFSFPGIKLRSLKGSSLQLISSNGRYFGPVVLGKKGRKVSTTLSGKNSTRGSALNLGRLNLRNGYASAAASLKSMIYTTPQIAADTSGKPTGAGNLGVVPASARTASLSSRGSRAASASSPGEDSDRDGIINAVDADDNNNGVLDSADPASEGTDTPYVSINFDFRRTLNAHVRDGLSTSAIDAMVSGENAFASTFFISLPRATSIDGGYMVCSDALTYCRPNNPLGYSGGVMESSDAFRGPMSSIVNSNGYPLLERLSIGSGDPAVVLSMQPRVGRDVFRPGDLYRVVLTSGSREVSSRTFALPPYFVSIPAIQEYTVNGVTTTVDYDSVTPDSGGIPGVSPGDPIVLGSDGLLSLKFWRPQREPLGAESGYQDFGGLNYGVIIDQLQATCAGLYTDVSGELVEDSNALGNGGSPLAHQGANLNPLVDQIGDRPANIANTLSLTVDLKTCISRAGGSPGTVRVSLIAAGTQVTGGRNAAVQIVYVSVP